MSQESFAAFLDARRAAPTKRGPGPGMTVTYGPTRAAPAVATSRAPTRDDIEHWHIGPTVDDGRTIRGERVA